MEGPDMFMSGYYGAGDGEAVSEKQRHLEKNSGEHFTIEDLLDFSNEDEVMTDAFFDSVTGNSTDSSTVTVVDSCNSSVSGNDTKFSGNFGCRSFSDAHFSGELCVPYDDLAELEWLSNFVEEDSFSTDDQYHLRNLHLISGASKPPTPDSSSQTQTQTHGPTRSIFPTNQPDTLPVPAKAQRSKRSRAAPCDWSSRLLHLLSPSSTSSFSAETKPKMTSSKKREGNANAESNNEGRKCLHCAAEKTPQWRTGPMGPKTLCNACGVRYKSGRLVAEYRPAASPTFLSTKHSNSHRKVLELRRQNEMHRGGLQHQNQAFVSQNTMFGVLDDGDYLIHHRTGFDYRHMM